MSSSELMFLSFGRNRSPNRATEALCSESPGRNRRFRPNLHFVVRGRRPRYDPRRHSGIPGRNRRFRSPLRSTVRGTMPKYDSRCHSGILDRNRRFRSPLHPYQICFRLSFAVRGQGVTRPKYVFRPRSRSDPADIRCVFIRTMC